MRRGMLPSGIALLVSASWAGAIRAKAPRDRGADTPAPLAGLPGAPGPGSRSVYVYDPAANSWTEEPLAMPRGIGACPSGFYNPDLNAHFIHVAGDSDDNGTTWADRYKKLGAARTQPLHHRHPALSALSGRRRGSASATGAEGSTPAALALVNGPRRPWNRMRPSDTAVVA